MLVCKQNSPKNNFSCVTIESFASYFLETKYLHIDSSLAQMNEIVVVSGRAFDAVITGIRPNRRRFSRSCKRVPGVLLYLTPLHRGRTNFSNQRGQNRSHAGRTRIHTRCGLGFLSQVSSNYSSLLKNLCLLWVLCFLSTSMLPKADNKVGPR